MDVGETYVVTDNLRFEAERAKGVPKRVLARKAREKDDNENPLVLEPDDLAFLKRLLRWHTERGR